jgi:hypothetical protein
LIPLGDCRVPRPAAKRGGLAVWNSWENTVVIEASYRRVEKALDNSVVRRECDIAGEPLVNRLEYFKMSIGNLGTVKVQVNVSINPSTFGKRCIVATDLNSGRALRWLRWCGCVECLALRGSGSWDQAAADR